MNTYDYRGIYDTNCPRCGGLRMRPGVAYGYGGPICHCGCQDPVQPTTQIMGGMSQLIPANTGWICPRCNKSNAPHKDKCDC